MQDKKLLIKNSEIIEHHNIHQLILEKLFIFKMKYGSYPSVIFISSNLKEEMNRNVGLAFSKSTYSGLDRIILVGGSIILIYVEYKSDIKSIELH